jgi:hypothetical protein
MGCYQVKKDYVERLCSEIKYGVNSSSSNFTYRSNSLDEEIVKLLFKHVMDLLSQKSINKHCDYHVNLLLQRHLLGCIISLKWLET